MPTPVVICFYFNRGKDIVWGVGQWLCTIELSLLLSARAGYYSPGVTSDIFELSSIFGHRQQIKKLHPNDDNIHLPFPTCTLKPFQYTNRGHQDFTLYPGGSVQP
ncbi:hypothetical protein XELAEV_18032866mg [Xenopus laevis]|uniref:Uncharacterized protein n=1 Tax=Xenopus laevis TaxID=8355 RepID=A0A974CKI2_XENLA|nr:hypothetical protein XELAEV_18032866mg [Xenopus laevis]